MNRQILELVEDDKTEYQTERRDDKPAHEERATIDAAKLHGRQIWKLEIHLAAAMRRRRHGGHVSTFSLSFLRRPGWSRRRQQSSQRGQQNDRRDGADDAHGELTNDQTH